MYLPLVMSLLLVMQTGPAFTNVLKLRYISTEDCLSADVVIVKTSNITNEILSECGRSQTLTCKFSENTSSIVWKYAQKITLLSQCLRGVCNLNPKYFDQLSYSFDKKRGIYNLTILEVTNKDNGKQFVCSDGSQSDSLLITVRDYEPRLLEYPQYGTIKVSSGCIDKDTNISFLWTLIPAENTKENRQFTPKILLKNTTRCSNDSDCGNDGNIQHTEIASLLPNEDGPYYIKIVAVYGNESKESNRTLSKYMIEDKEDRNSNILLGVVVPIVAGLLFGIIIIITLIKVIGPFLIPASRKRLNKPKIDKRENTPGNDNDDDDNADAENTSHADNGEGGESKLPEQEHLMNAVSNEWVKEPSIYDNEEERGKKNFFVSFVGKMKSVVFSQQRNTIED